MFQFHCSSFMQSCSHFSNIQLKKVINRWSTFTRQHNAMNENIRILLQGWVARVTLIIIINRYGPLVIGDYIFFCHHLFASSYKQWMQTHLCVLVILRHWSRAVEFKQQQPCLLLATFWQVVSGQVVPHLVTKAKRAGHHLRTYVDYIQSGRQLCLDVTASKLC